MTSQEKILQLREIIDLNLRSIINRDYYLLEIPYYSNVGDTLIWQGELDYLKTFSFKCLGMNSYESLNSPIIKENSLIIFQGGGNFGDLWIHPHEYKMKIVAENPSCEFLFMPQTVYFQDEENMKKCAEFLSCYNCTICARDNESYKKLQKYFKNKILLVPDMAFCINLHKWCTKYLNRKPLLIKRMDKELRITDYLESLDTSQMDVADWPTMTTKVPLVYKIRNKVRKYTPCLYDWYCQNIIRVYLINSGIKFIATHTDIYTTRLHGAILSILLNKRIVFIDNSYNKNRYFYETWLTDCDSIIMAK